VIHYCTYFDRNYLTRAIALHSSLVRHSPPFTLWALALDAYAYAALEALTLEGVRPVRLADLEAAEPELLAVKGTRSTVEYYFTCSPCLPLHLMRTHPEIELLTYLDADLLFYSSPEPIFSELGAGSVLIVPHRFPEHLRHLEEYGVYNVGLLSFRNDVTGHAILERWRAQCLEWCFDRVENGRFADQKYLDDWPETPGVVVSENPGVDLAPWNVTGHRLDLAADPPLVDDRALVVYHFHGVKAVRPWIWDLGLANYGLEGGSLVDRLYRPYVQLLQRSSPSLRPFRPSWVRSGKSTRTAAPDWRTLAGRLRRRQAIISLGLPR
jgi:hypothetical protein